MSRPAVAAAFSILVAWLVAGPAVADTQSCADFREAVQKGMKGVILVDLKMKWMEPYSDRTNRIHVDF
ncbi:hypothetical protein ACKI16_47465, partial [Streptomyces scabiei]|uniref:hypothetical protein n=2 Tax=Bacteria TaxID=2 RepID=UPI0038F67A8A